MPAQSSREPYMSLTASATISKISGVRDLVGVMEKKKKKKKNKDRKTGKLSDKAMEKPVSWVIR